MKEIKELEVDNEVLKWIETICRFACVKPTIKNGSIINVKGSDIVFVNDYSSRIKLKDLEFHIKTY